MKDYERLIKITTDPFGILMNTQDAQLRKELVEVLKNLETRIEALEAAQETNK